MTPTSHKATNLLNSVCCNQDRYDAPIVFNFMAFVVDDKAVMEHESSTLLPLHCKRNGWLWGLYLLVHIVLDNKGLIPH